MKNVLKGKPQDGGILPWDELPEFMRKPEIRSYWEVLWQRRTQLRVKRAFDVVLSAFLIVILILPMFLICIAIKLDSRGPVLFRQIRVTQYGRRFIILKFRTMIDGVYAKNKDGKQIDSLVTVANDSRITKVGGILRKYRLDEFPQLFNVLIGDMSFVGTRPEVPIYVDQYRSSWYATLLLPSGITSECSIRFVDENRMLEKADNVDIVYVNEILPMKMRINLKSIKQFSLRNDILAIIRTVMAVLS